MAATVGRLQAVLSADTKDFDKAMGRSEKSFSKLGKAAKYGGLAVAAGAAYGFKKFAEEAIEAEKVTAQTEAVLKSTGGAAGVTAKQVDTLANSLLRKSGVDDEQIKSGANMLLTFTNIRNEAGKGNDVFTQTTKTLLDMSIATGQDMPKAAVMLGKAINDPIAGIGALSRVGVTFTADQKDMIKEMVKAGDTMGAQKVILGELSKEFGGSAEAAGKTFAGQVNIAKESLSNAGGEIVGKMLPTLTKFVTILASDVIPKLFEWGAAVKNAVQPVLAAIVSWIQLNWPTISKVFTEVFDAVKTVTETLVRAAEAAWPKIQKAAEAVAAWYRVNLGPTIESVARNIQTVWGALTVFWDQHGEEILRITKRVFGTLERIIKPQVEAVVKVINTILALFRGDWYKAWNEIKQVPLLILQSLALAITGLGGLFVDAIKGLASLAWEAAKQLGSDIVGGVVQGIKDAPGIGASLLDKIKGPSGLDLVKKAIGAASPSTLFAKEVGEPISEGVAQGIIDKREAILNALYDVVNDAIDDAKTRVSRVVSELSATLSFGFESKLGAQQTPAEKRIEAIQAASAQQALEDNLASARKALEAARLIKDTSDRKAAVAAAQKQIRDAEEAILMAGLERQAAIERANLDERQKAEKIQFDARLANLQDFLASGEATAAEAQERITKFMKNFGITMSDMGELLGLSYAEGLRAQIPAAVHAAQDLADSIAKLKVLDTRKAAEKAAGEALMAKVEAATKKAAEEAKAKAAAEAKAKTSKTSAASGPWSAGDVVGNGPASLDRGLWDEYNMALGFTTSIGTYNRDSRLPGSNAPSDHAVYPSKAFDAMFSPATGYSNPAAREFFDAMIGRAGIHYAILGGKIWSQERGLHDYFNSTDHANHVHVSGYDRGGWLQPGWTMAYNGTGRPEAVGGGSAVFNVNVGGESFIQIVWDGIRRKAQVFERQNGRPAFGGGA